MKKFLKILVFLIILGAVGVYLERSGYFASSDKNKLEKGRQEI